MGMELNEIAAAIHRRMCEDPRFGYSWEERYGAIPKVWEIGGKKYPIDVGDYECGTSCKTAWAVALQGTPWEGCLDGYTNSTSARRVFTGSGLFVWKPMSFLACPGDLYVNEANHVAMCQTQVPDVLSEFCWGEYGAYGNKRGDQTGWESRVAPFYEYEDGGWDGILHFVGTGAVGGSSSTKVARPPMPRYRVAVMRGGKKTWLPWMGGMRDTGGSGETFGGIAGVPIVDVQFKKGTLGPKGWFHKNMRGGKLIGLTVYYDTPEPKRFGYHKAMYRVHWVGAKPGWAAGNSTMTMAGPGTTGTRWTWSRSRFARRNWGGRPGGRPLGVLDYLTVTFTVTTLEAAAL